MTARMTPADGGAAEPDMSWVLLGVAKNDVFVLDYAPGWREFIDGAFFEDSFACDAPTHLAPGAYLWTGYKLGFWDEGDHINIAGGDLCPFIAVARQERDQ